MCKRLFITTYYLQLPTKSTTYCGWTMDGPVFTIDSSWKSQRRWWSDYQIYECSAYLFVKFLQCSILGFGVTRNLHHSYRSIHEHCDLQTDISNCLGYIISWLQIDLTLPCCSSLPLHTIITDQFVPKETQKIAGLQLFRTQNICNGLTGDVLKIVLILCTWQKWQKYETYLACKEWLVSATVKKCFIGFEINTALILYLWRQIAMFTFRISGRKYTLILHMNLQPSDSSHEISFLIWFLRQKCCLFCFFLFFFVVSFIITCDNCKR